MHYVLVVNSTIILNLIVVCSSYLFDAYVQIKKSGNNSAKLLPKPRLSDFSGLSSCLFLGLQPERCAYPWNNKFKGMRHSQCQDNWIPSLAPWIGWSNWWRGGGESGVWWRPLIEGLSIKIENSVGNFHVFHACHFCFPPLNTLISGTNTLLKIYLTFQICAL